MGFPAQLDRTNVHFPDDDKVSHFAARELQIFLRIGVVVSIVVTAITTALLPFWLWIPLIALIACMVPLIVVNGIEQRTRAERYERAHREHVEESAHRLHPDADSTIEGHLLARDDDHFTPMSLLKKESVIGIEIIVGLALAAVALVIVGVVTGHIAWELVMIGVGLFVVYGLLVMAPVWLGLFTDVEEVARGTQSNERRA